MKYFTDGAGKGKNNFGRCAFVREDGYQKIEEFNRIQTSNEAEYLGIILALEDALKNKYISTEIYSDSLLIVNQLNKKYRLTRVNLAKLAKIIWEKYPEINKSFIWVSRKENEAGKLLEKAKKENLNEM